MTELDLTPFLAAHQLMRHEYGRLAAVARNPRDGEHQALIEEQLVIVLGLLHHHHHREEDDWLWPTLRDRAPAARPGLDQLEAEHEQLDPLIEAAADTSRPLAGRAGVLAELHRVINGHLDAEERIAVPLIQACLTAGEWDASGHRALAALPPEHLPVIFGWLGEMPAEQLARMSEVLPVQLREQLHHEWIPAYDQRRRRLYGQLSQAAGHAATGVAAGGPR
jgi:Hemerythrin HHE cation binding domain